VERLERGAKRLGIEVQRKDVEHVLDVAIEPIAAEAIEEARRGGVLLFVVRVELDVPNLLVAPDLAGDDGHDALEGDRDLRVRRPDLEQGATALVTDFEAFVFDRPHETLRRRDGGDARQHARDATPRVEVDARIAEGVDQLACRRRSRPRERIDRVDVERLFRKQRRRPTPAKPRRRRRTTPVRRRQTPRPARRDGAAPVRFRCEDPDASAPAERTCRA
jgi:hypothetical protein